MYKSNMCQEVIELMAVGYSKTAVAAKLGICKDTLYQWVKDEDKKEFADAIKIGETLSQGWWEEEARIALKDRDFNSTLWFMNVKNRFKDDWRDKHETEHSGNMQVNWPLGKSALDE